MPGGFAGTFEQLVLTDSLSALVASPPLLYVTNAKKFCDWRLVFTAVTFQVIITKFRTDLPVCKLLLLLLLCSLFRPSLCISSVRDELEQCLAV